MIRLIDRVGEMDVLEKDWRTSENAFIAVFGRRRIGKTRLLEEFLKEKEGIKYTGEDASKKIQISEFRKAIGSYLKDDFLITQEIDSWSALFSYLAKVLPKDKRFYIWVDEFSYWVKSDKTLTSVLQKFCDFIRSTKIVFIVSGSLFGLMSEEVLSSSSPLYGRRTRDILLKPLQFRYVSEFLPFDFEDALKTAFTVGGVPEYLLVASKKKSYDEFISDEFFKTEGYFYREPYYLLSQEFKEIRIYFSILNAIAYGNTKPTEIANFVGIKGREIYPYLELLINYGFVNREASFQDSKRGTYRIADNFFDFWFNLVHRNREMIERGTYKPDKQEFNSYFGKRFEALLRDNAGVFFSGYEKTGRWWHADKEIDIVAIKEKEKEMAFGECKWEDGVNALQIAKELNEKTKFVEWFKDTRKESFAVFARTFSKRINEFEGKKVSCYDLDDIKRIMLREKK